VFQGTVLRQAGQLAFVVADQRDGIFERIDGLNETANEGLHGCERAINFNGAGVSIRLD
jgi:hypothetical protein